MDSLIPNGIDPALLRVLEKHGRERDPEMRRRRVPTAPAADEKAQSEKDEAEADPESPKHELDDLV